MKLIITLSLLFIAVNILVSCKKTDAPTPVSPAPVSRDYSASIKDKSWLGEITYTGKTPEYYSVYFKADGTLLWSQFSGDYPGHWAIKDKELTMTFDGNTVAIKATITDDDKLSNISDNTNSYEVNNGALLSNPNITLDNTTRVGVLSPLPIQMIFMPGAKVEVQLAGVVSSNQAIYTRTAAGATLRFTAYYLVLGTSINFFGVITPTGEIRGTASGPNGDTPWYLLKL